MNQVTFKEIQGNNPAVKVAIFNFIGSDDPTLALNEAVRSYVGHEPYNEFIDANMDNPWIRVIIKGINDLNGVAFRPGRDRI